MFYILVRSNIYVKVLGESELIAGLHSFKIPLKTPFMNFLLIRNIKVRLFFRQGLLFYQNYLKPGFPTMIKGTTMAYFGCLWRHCLMKSFASSETPSKSSAGKSRGAVVMFRRVSCSHTRTSTSWIVLYWMSIYCVHSWFKFFKIHMKGNYSVSGTDITRLERVSDPDPVFCSFRSKIREKFIHQAYPNTH